MNTRLHLQCCISLGSKRCCNYHNVEHASCSALTANNLITLCHALQKIKHYAGYGLPRRAPRLHVASVLEMAKVQLLNVAVLDNPTAFLNPFQFEITFECSDDLPNGKILNVYKVTPPMFLFL